MYRKSQTEISFYLTKDDMAKVWDNYEADLEWADLTDRQRTEAEHAMIEQILTIVFNDIGNDNDNQLHNVIADLSETYQEQGKV